MPAELAGERIAIMIGTLTTALADRAAAIDAGAPLQLDHERSSPTSRPCSSLAPLPTLCCELPSHRHSGR